MRPLYPRLLRCPVFLPLAWIIRLFRLLFKDNKKGKKTHDIMQSVDVDEDYISQVSGIMKRMHLQ